MGVAGGSVKMSEQRKLSHMVKIRNVLAGHVACMGSREMHTWFWWGTLKE